MVKIDLTGHRFGRWTVIMDTGERKNGIVYLCRCDCGTTKKVRVSNLRNRGSQSCGCLHREAIEKRGATRKPIDGVRRHSQPLYSVYNNMINRCYNPKNKAYKHYGGKGVGVCDEWKNSYLSFKAWAISSGFVYCSSKATRDMLTIDRKDSNGNYEPSNCHWIPFRDNIAKRNREQGKSFKATKEAKNGTS